MSLFPAYSSKTSTQNDDKNEEFKETNKDSVWLKNSSYEQVSTCLGSAYVETPNEYSSSDENSDEKSSSLKESNTSIESKKNLLKAENNVLESSKKRKNKEDNSHSVQYETRVVDLYFEDKERNKKFCKLETLDFPIRPNYRISDKKLGIRLRRQSKKGYYKRYHAINFDVKKKSIKNNPSTEYTDHMEIGETINLTDKSKLQQQQTAEVEKFNKKLALNPKDVNTWIKFALFQEKIVQSSQFFSESKCSKYLINQKKLAIIERSLTENSDSIELLKLKLKLMSELLPADQFSNQIEVMINKDSKNIILWQTLITAIRNSCAICKVSKILNLYKKCFQILKQKSKTDSKFYDRQILNLLYQCLIFLRHTGLWEQMWEIIKINLCLNLAFSHETLQNPISINEKTLINMEELILSSKLPLNQLWLRIESLRENCHWIGIDVEKADINIVGDEKRLVSAEETTDFIYPTISRESNFRLAILFILCLKVPLLPNRHSTMKDFNLEEYFWSIDSLEFILPMIYPTIWSGELDDRISNKTVITDLLEAKLTSGPQYLKFHPAQEPFLNFVRSVFSTVASSFSGVQRTSIMVWWLRFERLLVFVSRCDPLSEANRNKKIRSIVKNFLKKPENRNNLHFYREYSMIEYEFGSCDNSIQILKAIIQSQDINSLDIEEQAALMSLYRTIIEIKLNSLGNENLSIEIFQEIVKYLEKFILICFQYDIHLSAEEMLYNQILKFLISPPTDESYDRFLLPNMYCDMLICYSYILFIKNNKSETMADILNLFDRCLTHCKNCLHLRERFYETKVVFLQFYLQRIKTMNCTLTKTVNEALLEFPSNFFFLSISALSESELPFWKLKTTSKNLTIWSILATCLAGRARIAFLKSIEFDEAYRAMINKMLSFHKTVSRENAVQNCPLVWKFYMLLLQEHNLCEKRGEEIYYEAITQCPWSRSVYINAAEIAPQILSQIQDLIKEKELRMHVTPEELDILRQ